MNYIGGLEQRIDPDTKWIRDIVKSKLFIK